MEDHHMYQMLMVSRHETTSFSAQLVQGRGEEGAPGLGSDKLFSAIRELQEETELVIILVHYQCGMTRILPCVQLCPATCRAEVSE